MLPSISTDEHTCRGVTATYPYLQYWPTVAEYIHLTCLLTWLSPLISEWPKVFGAIFVGNHEDDLMYYTVFKGDVSRPTNSGVMSSNKVVVSGVRRLSTISEQDPDKVDTDLSSQDPMGGREWGGSSFSLCSNKHINNSSDHFSSFESHQPDAGGIVAPPFWKLRFNGEFCLECNSIIVTISSLTSWKARNITTIVDNGVSSV